VSQFLPCLKAWVSLRLFYDPPRFRQHSHACHNTKRQTTRNQLHNTTHHRLQPQEMEKNKGGIKNARKHNNNKQLNRILRWRQQNAKTNEVPKRKRNKTKRQKIQIKPKKEGLP